MKRPLIAAAFVLAAAAPGPAFAGQSATGFGLSDAVPGLPPPAESGKPAIVSPPAAAAGQIEPGRCVAALPCGTRLLGTIRKNGAIELQVPAWRW